MEVAEANEGERDGGEDGDSVQGEVEALKSAGLDLLERGGDGLGEVEAAVGGLLVGDPGEEEPKHSGDGTGGGDKADHFYALLVVGLLAERVTWATTWPPCSATDWKAVRMALKTSLSSPARRETKCWPRVKTPAVLVLAMAS